MTDSVLAVIVIIAMLLVGVFVAPIVLVLLAFVGAIAGH